MAYRMEALKRIAWGLVFIFVVLPIGGGLLLLLGGLTWAFDSLWQLVTGNEGITSDTPLTSLFDWFKDNVDYLLTGEGDANFIPFV